MGAVCYKPKPTSISKEEVLRAINDKHLRETITEPEGFKTVKTDEQGNNMLLTFGSLSQHLNIDTQTVNEISSNSTHMQSTVNKSWRKFNSRGDNGFSDIQLKILTYFGSKDDIYDLLTKMSRNTLFFMKKQYRTIENMSSLKQSNERIRFSHVKSIEEHSSGVNQLLKINNKELVTASDDCYMKFWNAQTMKAETSIATETITCIALTGNNSKQQKDILVAGCHSGNLIMISVAQKAKKEQMTSAHYNLIRVIVSLEALKNRYFVTADVCGVVKVWTSHFKLQQIMEIEQEGAISYNSMIEVTDLLPKRSFYEDKALIACALKSQKINLILLMPSLGNYQVIKTLKSSLKPTCLIQLSSRHLAIAVGSLKEESHIEIHDMNKGKIVSTLKKHTDMIDSMLKLHFPPDKVNNTNPYITWFVSASRDRQIVLWKLIDGKVMRRNELNLINSSKKSSMSNGFRTIDQLQNKVNSQKLDRSRKNRKQRRNKEEQEDEQLLDEQSSNEVNNFVNEEVEEQKSNTVDKESGKVQNSPQSNQNSLTKRNESMIDYYYAFDTGHKDFVRSMVQINNGNTLITASEDKTLKVFTISF